MNNKEPKVEPTTESGNSTKPLVVRSCFVVEFKNGIHPFWLADWEGDPGRTLRIENAIHFKCILKAEMALAKAKADNPHRKLDGRIVPCNCH